MAEQTKEDKLAVLADQLNDRFKRWDYLFTHGGSDPAWPDGLNLNLIRGHILYYKECIEQLMCQETEELSLFGVSYPDIYYRATPEEVPDSFMVKADEIRERAAQQMALYEKDPNYLFILENHDKVFPKGETKATKAAGLNIWSTAGVRGYRLAFDSGNLVELRSKFYEPYESKAIRWAEAAQKLKAFLEMEHDPADDVVVKSDFDDGEDLPEEDFEKEASFASTVSQKPSLESRIQDAHARKTAQPEVKKPRQEQMTLF